MGTAFAQIGERYERVYGPDLWPIRCQAARLRTGWSFASQYDAAPWARCGCFRRREQHRAQTAQARRHDGLHVRDSLSAAGYGLCRPIQIASERLRRLRAPSEKALQPEAALRTKTMARLNETHDPKRQSWITSANGHTDFPIQNLPVGIFSPPGSVEKRGGIAIGDMIFDLAAAAEAGLFAGAARDAAEATSSGSLNELFALGEVPRQALRTRASELLDVKGPDSKRVEGVRNRILHRAADCVLYLPAR